MALRTAKFQAYAHTANLVLGASIFLYAMRSCKYIKTTSPGHTKHIWMGCIELYTLSRRVVKLINPNLLKVTNYITIIFKDQKNGKRMDTQTHQQYGHAYLCSILCWGSAAIQRIIPRVPYWTY